MATGTHSLNGAQPRYQRDIATKGALIAKRGVARNEYVEIHEDFFGDAGQTLPPPWKYAETGSSTNPTGDYSAAADGRFVLTHSADSEAQSMRVDWGDSTQINLSKKPVFEARLAVNFAGANFSADQRIVIGLASAYNATLDSIATNAWFRIEGANLNILAETDDGTTDDDDNDTGIDIVDNTMTVFEIDCSDLSAVRFSVDGVHAAVLDMSDVTANTLVQPIIAIQRDAGTEQEVVTIDYVRVTAERS